MSNGKNCNRCHKSLDRTASSRAPSHCEWHPLAASYGCFGVIFQQNAMAIIGLFPVGSIGGEKQGFATDMVKPDAASRCSRKDRLEVHFVDGTVVRAHQHAAGAKGDQRLRL